jgi:hypothetical protein
MPQWKTSHLYVTIRIQILRLEPKTTQKKPGTVVHPCNPSRTTSPRGKGAHWKHCVKLPSGCKVYVKCKWISCLLFSFIPKLSHCLYANIPKSETLLTPSILNKGYTQLVLMLGPHPTIIKSDSLGGEAQALNFVKSLSSLTGWESLHKFRNLRNIPVSQGEILLKFFFLWGTSGSHL